MAFVGVAVAAVLIQTAITSEVHADTAEALADEVKFLPGAVAPLPSRQFSGYLNNGAGGHLHYWLVESESDPKVDPVALWLNGGPGASSLMGYLTEFGPYVIAADGGINYNPYNWAKHATMLFFESPAGVGFSYCEGNISAVCKADDQTTAAGNLHALRAFFARFPKFHAKPFMVWGESYAGVYVPTLSHQIALADPPLPVSFLGFSVGNPCTADKFQVKSHLGSFMSVNPDYALTVGLINDKLHSVLTGDCSEEKDQSPKCKEAWRTFSLLVSGLSGPPTKMFGLGNGAGFLDNYDMSYIGSMQPYWDATAAYLNRDDVRHAIHMQHSPHWGLFATRLVYEKQYEACRFDDPEPDNTAPQYPASMLPIYKALVNSGHSVLLYSGDADPSVQWRGSELCVRKVGFPEGEGRAWRPWFYREQPAPLELLAVKAPEWGPSLSASARRGDTVVLGGYTEEFVSKDSRGTLTFATVHGVGHMTPQFGPQASLHLFDRTMQAAVQQKGSPPNLAPLLPGGVIANSSSKSFYGDGSKSGLLGKWLESAQALAIDGAAYGGGKQAKKVTAPLQLSSINQQGLSQVQLVGVLAFICAVFGTVTLFQYHGRSSRASLGERLIDPRKVQADV